MRIVLSTDEAHKEAVEEILAVIAVYGNAPDIRAEDFRQFVLEALAEGMSEDLTASGFIALAIEAYRDLKGDDK